MRVARLLGIAVLACTEVVGTPATAAPAPVAQPCTQFAASPTFATDGAAYCAGEVRDVASGNTTALAVFRTTNSGRTWTKAAGTGLPPPQGSNILRDLVVSPRHAVDRAVYLQLAIGLWGSLDGGETFLPVDPLAWGRVTPYIAAPPADAPLGDTAAHTLFAHALRGDVEGANRSTIIDPTSRVRTPVKGSPGLDREFAISPDFAKDGLAYVVAEHGVGLTRHFRLYGCSVALECSTPLYRWPNRWTFDRLWLAGDFAKSRTMFASVLPIEGLPTLWRSRDGGKTFTRWTAAEKVRGGDAQVALGAVPGSTHLYLRVSGHGGATPYDQLFWSRDNGAKWTRVSYGRTPLQRGPRGSMPPTAMPGTGNDDTPRGVVTATGGGRLFVVGRTYDGTARYDSFWCTTDNGRSWSRTCR